MSSEERFGDRLRKQIKEIYSVASEKTEEYARIGKKRLDILSLSRDVAREKRALGERVYDLSRRESSASVLEDVTVRAILGRIESLEAEMQSREKEIDRIREEARTADEGRRRARETAAAEAAHTAESPESSGEAGPPSEKVGTEAPPKDVQ
jgi:hypothetical protein